LSRKKEKTRYDILGVVYMFDQKQFSNRLYELRKDHDKTQAQIAEYLQTTQQQYQKYESGSQELPVRRLYQLAELYNVSADYILGLPKNLYWPR
jgi:transcriptional regulator with XRE-family HTH domain